MGEEKTTKITKDTYETADDFAPIENERQQFQSEGLNMINTDDSSYESALKNGRVINYNSSIFDVDTLEQSIFKNRQQIYSFFKVITSLDKELHSSTANFNLSNDEIEKMSDQLMGYVGPQLKAFFKGFATLLELPVKDHIEELEKHYLELETLIENELFSFGEHAVNDFYAHLYSITNTKIHQKFKWNIRVTFYFRTLFGMVYLIYAKNASQDGQNDAGWFYHSQATFEIGIARSFESILFLGAKIDEKKVSSSHGGKLKKKNQYDSIKQQIVELLEERYVNNERYNRITEAIKAIIEEATKLAEEEQTKGRCAHLVTDDSECSDALEKRIRSWAKESPLKEAFAKIVQNKDSFGSK